jgi:hypothetical protein
MWLFHMLPSCDAICQDDIKFKANLCYIMRSCLKKRDVKLIINLDIVYIILDLKSFRNFIWGKDWYWVQKQVKYIQKYKLVENYQSNGQNLLLKEKKIQRAIIEAWYFINKIKEIGEWNFVFI